MTAASEKSTFVIEWMHWNRGITTEEVEVRGLDAAIAYAAGRVKRNDSHGFFVRLKDAS